MYCPIVKDICKQGECVMWRADCLIRMFFDSVVSRRQTDAKVESADSSYLDNSLEVINLDILAYAKKHIEDTSIP
jgi:hypothetical protein